MNLFEVFLECGVTFRIMAGLLHENDELLDVNGYDLRNKELDEVCDILVSIYSIFVLPFREYCHIMNVLEYFSKPVSYGYSIG